MKAIEQNQSNIQSIKSALSSFLPYEDDNFILKVKSINVNKIPDVTLKDYKEARIKGKSLTVPVYANFELYKKGKTPKLIDKAKVKVANLPLLFGHTLAYLVDGTDYQIQHQLRRKPAIYTTIKADGTISSDINTKVGQNMKLIMIPEKGQFNLQLGSSHIPVYALLKALGASDEKIKSEFPAVFDKLKLPESRVEKEQDRLATLLNFGRKPGSHQEAINYIKKRFGAELFDPKVNQYTIGKPAKKFDVDTILATMKKIIKVNTDVNYEDNPDDLAFKSLHGPDDFILERFRLGSEPKRLYDSKIANRLKNHKKISEIVSRDFVNHQLKSLFSNYDLVNIPTQLNFVNFLSGSNTVTILGSGGIRNDRAVTLNNRNLQYSHAGFLDPIHTPEGPKTGVTLHMSLGAKKNGNELTAQFRNVKTGKIEVKSPIDVFDHYVVLPDQEKLLNTNKKVQAIYRGKKVEIPASKAEYVIPKTYLMFDVNSNLIPYLQNTYGVRALVAAKMMEQALPLKDPEPPLIRTMARDKSFEKTIGELAMSYRSPIDGKVEKVTKNTIVLRDKSGKTHKIPLVDNIILNSDSAIDIKPIVQPGDKIKKDQLIAETQYTKNGVLALGKNLTVGYMPWHGYNFEDGVVVSEGAAKKLTSRHIYTKEIEIEPDSITDKEKFMARFPSLFTADQLKSIGPDGINTAKMVQKDDPIFLYMKKVEPTYEDKLFGLISKTFMRPYKNRSVIWDKDVPGMIVGVSRRGKKVRIYISTEEPLKVGDKISGRYGNKGVVTKILPDNEMPKLKDGNPVELLFNPLGIPSRMNLGQVYETLAGKIADKVGKPISVANFSDQDTHKYISKMLKNFKIPDKEKLINPNTGRPFKNPVLVGKQFIMKLNHQAEHKLDARYRAGYDSNMQPISGGEEGGKKLDQLTLYAMLAHGARNNIREAVTYKGDKNDEFWRALEMGLPLPPPKPTFAFNKFLAYLNNLGVDVTKNGNHMFLMPMTDKQIKEMSAGEIKKPYAVRGKDFKPIEDGLFDVYKTGGLSGNKFAHIKLPETIPNPMFESTIKILTGLKDSEYSALLSGKLFLRKDGSLSTKEAPSYVTGTKAIAKLLSKIDIDKSIKDLKSQAKRLRGAALNRINRKLRYLVALKNAHLTPDKAYLLSTVPVIPPVFRPMYTANGDLKLSDLNVGYHDILTLSNALKEAKGLPEQQKAPARKRLYDSVKALMGLGNPVGHRPFRGILDIITGTKQPKMGFFQSTLVKKRQDLSGRAAITVEPSYGIDEVGLPEDIAWTLYRPFIIRRLVKLGKKPSQAVQEVDAKSDQAKKALQLEAKERPILINRAPSLHKFSIMAFYPKIIPEPSLKINPLITKAFNADFDGDTMSIFVPITDKAVSEAKERLLASRNIFKPGENRVILAPSQEALLGLYELSKSTNGKKQLKSILGKYWDGKPLTSETINTLLTEIARKDRYDFIKITQSLKDLGYKAATELGLSFGLGDFSPLKHLKGSKNVTSNLKKQKDLLVDSALSGARGSFNSIRQMRVAIDKVYDIVGHEHKGITSNFAEGLPLTQYIDSLFGARKGMIDKGTSVREPGALAKNIINTTMDKIIVQDSSNGPGLEMKLSDRSIYNRYLAKPVKRGKRILYPKDTLLTSDIVNDLKRRKIKSVTVRSPITDTTPKGLASKDFGIMPWGSRPDIGENLGIIASHSITEPLSQSTLKRFHSGGVNMEQGGLAKIKSILEMPLQLKNRAILSDIDGTVKSIKKDPLGGHVVTVNKKEFYIPGRLSPVIKKGDKIKKGDRLSTGEISPHDIFKLKGIIETRKFIANELHRAIGKDFDKRYAEVIARSLTDKAVVLNPGKSGFLPGDTVDLNEIAQHKDVKYQPILVGANFYPTKSHDWLARLNSRELKKTLVEGVSQGWSTDIHGVHPIPALVYGQEFGLGKGGRY